MKLAIAVVVMMLSGSVAQADAKPRGQLKQLLLERFDRDQDGRLDKHERRKAARALQRLAHRLAQQELRNEMRGEMQPQDPYGPQDPFGARPNRMPRDPFRAQPGHMPRDPFRAQGRQQMRGEMRQERQRHKQQRRFIRRFDLNRDGNVGPGEMPPTIADELRPLDADGDGWLRGDELP